MPHMTTPPQPPPGGHPQPTRQGPYPPPQYAPPGVPPISPPPGAPPGFYPPPPPRKKPSFWGSTGGILLIVFGSIGLVGVLCGGLITIGRISDQNALKNIDVQVTSCTSTGVTATIGYTVKNSGSQDRRVTLKVEYRDASGARLDTDTAYVGNVPAGDTVRGEESTILNASTTGNITCKVTGVS